MSDDLEKLQAALKASEPAPDPARKAEALSRAMAEFERVQGSAERLRPMSDRPARAGLWTGVAAMLSTLTSRAALAGTASVAVLALGIVILNPDLMRPRPLSPGVSGGEIEVGRAVGPRVETEAAAAPSSADAPETGASASATAKVEADALAADERVARQSEAESLDRAQAPPMAAPAPAPMADATALNEMFAAAPAENRARSAAEGAPLGAVAPGIAAPELAQPTLPNTEAFPEAERNPLKVTAEEPVSTFSIDVDTASYAVVRSSLMMGLLPPPEAVRIEEMINYFPYAWPAPEAGEAPFRPTVSVIATPWNDGTRLVTVALQGRLPDLETRPPLNLVFLIDTSGSMQDANKLPLLKQSFRLMLSELRPEDQVAIVTYAGSAGRVLDATSAGERETILAALDRLEAGGSTAGQEGLRLAYATARGMAEDGEVTRVILATDGDFNVGISDPEELEAYIAKEREGGTYLSVLGFGRGNLDDATMQALAQNGNGSAAYIDTLNEARKVLVDELSGALFPIADDVKIQIEWNPATVAEYRLIGYETRALAREDFSNDKVDAGEIGAGHAVTAIYEITPVGSPARRTDPLRYAAPEAAGPASELGFLRLRYKEPGEDTSQLIEAPIPVESAAGGQEARFAAAIAGFGQLLADPKYLGDWGWAEAVALATENRGADEFGYRAEAVGLMRLAESLSR